MIITADRVKELRIGYKERVLYKLFGDGRTPSEVAGLQEGEWANFSLIDRVVILCLIIGPEGRREYLARLVDRVIKGRRVVDDRSVKVLTALRGNAVTDEHVEMALDAYHDEMGRTGGGRGVDAAFAVMAAAEAAIKGGIAVTACADRAALAAQSRNLELRQQLKDLVELFGDNK